MAITIITANTKGGPGKTTISTQVIPALFADTDKEIKIYELDNNNSTKLKNSSIAFETMRADEGEDAIFGVGFDAEEDSNIINIIDAGGGDDTLKVLAGVKEADIRDAIYLVPVNDDMEQIDNAAQTIKAIKEIQADANIVLILNRAIILDGNIEKSIKEQYVGLFGSEDYGIASRADEKIFENVKIAVVPNSKIFGITKNIDQTTISDIYPNYKELIDNIDKHKKEWRAAGKEVYIDSMKKKRIAEEMIALVDSFTPLKKMMGV